MRKYILFALILLVFCKSVYCESITYVTLQDSYLEQNFVRTATVTERDILIFRNRIREHSQIFVRTENGKEGWINTAHISLKDSLPLTDSITSKYWTYSYYQDIISKRNGEVLFEYEPFWQNEYDDFIMRSMGDKISWWRYSSPTRFDIRDTVCSIHNFSVSGYIDFVNTKIQQDNNIITIQVICVNKSDDHPEYYLNQIFNEGETYSLIFKIDGNYMDVFVNNEEKKLCTLIGVEESFIKTINSITKDEPFDLSQIIWPRRANGTMDYPPPIDMNSYKTTHHTTDNLRLRDNPNTSSLMVTTLSKGSAVQVLETGEMQTIDGITAPWVKVLSESGYTGWCFSGYLEAIPKEEPVIVPVSTTPEPSEHTENIEPVRSDISKTNVFDTPIPVAVGGGIVLVAVGIILVVKRKKKN